MIPPECPSPFEDKMTKDEIINELLTVYGFCECGYTRSVLEQLPETELERWLKELRETKKELKRKRNAKFGTEKR